MQKFAEISTDDRNLFSPMHLTAYRPQVVSLVSVGFGLWFVCPSYLFVVLLLPDAHSDCARHHQLHETAKTVSASGYEMDR